MAGRTAYSQEVITILRGQDFPPYHYIDEKGEQTGFIIEIVQSVANTMGINISFKQYSWSRCLWLVEHGQADAMMNLFKTKEREQFMYFFNNILAFETNQFFKLKDLQIVYDGNLSSLNRYKIGAIFNYSYGSQFDNTKFSNIFRLEAEDDLIKSLVNRRTDLIIGNKKVMLMLLNKMGAADSVEPVLPIVSKDPLYIGFSKKKGHDELAENFSNALNRFKKGALYNDILKKY